MADGASTTFYEESGRAYGRHAAGFAAIVAAFGVIVMISPLRWKGTSIPLSIGLGLVFIALSAALFRWSRRLRRVALITTAAGITIKGPRHDHQLRWDQVRGFTPGWVSGVAARAEMPVVVAELVDGRRIVVQALRVDYGPFKAKQAEARVRHLCQEIERRRPAAALAGHGAPASAT